MSTIIYIGQSKPEPKLEKTMNFKAYLSAEEKKNILEELGKLIDDLKDYDVNMHVEIEIKKYKK